MCVHSFLISLFLFRVCLSSVAIVLLIVLRAIVHAHMIVTPVVAVTAVADRVHVRDHEVVIAIVSIHRSATTTVMMSVIVDEDHDHVRARIHARTNRKMSFLTYLTLIPAHFVMPNHHLHPHPPLVAPHILAIAIMTATATAPVIVIVIVTVDVIATMIAPVTVIAIVPFLLKSV